MPNPDGSETAEEWARRNQLQFGTAPPPTPPPQENLYGPGPTAFAPGMSPADINARNTAANQQAQAAGAGGWGGAIKSGVDNLPSTQIVKGAMNYLGVKGPDVKGLDAVAQETANTRAAFANDLDAMKQGRSAPQINPADFKPGAAATVTAPNVNPTERAQATNAYAGQIGQAAQAQAGQAGQVERFQAAQIGKTNQAVGAQVGAAERIAGAGLDTSQANAARSGQANLASMLETQASGGGPSVGEAMLNSALAKTRAQQASAAAGARGAGAARMQRQAAVNMEAAQADAANKSAEIKAQEAIAARGQLGNALQGMRGLDVDTAKTGAQLQQEAALANQRERNAQQLSQAQMNQQAGLLNVQNDADRAKQQALLEQQARAAGAGAQNEANQAQAGRDTTVSVANAGAVNDINKAQAGLNTQVSVTNAGNATDISKTNAGAENDRSKFVASLDLQTQKANQDAMNQFAMEAGKIGLQAATANMEATLKSRGLDDNMVQALMKNILESQGLSIDAIKAKNEAQRAHNEQVGGAFKSAGQALAGMG